MSIQPHILASLETLAHLDPSELLYVKNQELKRCSASFTARVWMMLNPQADAVRAAIQEIFGDSSLFVSHIKLVQNAGCRVYHHCKYWKDQRIEEQLNRLLPEYLIGLVSKSAAECFELVARPDSPLYDGKIDGELDAPMEGFEDTFTSDQCKRSSFGEYASQFALDVNRLTIMINGSELSRDLDEALGQIHTLLKQTGHLDLMLRLTRVLSQAAIGHLMDIHKPHFDQFMHESLTGQLIFSGVTDEKRRFEAVIRPNQIEITCTVEGVLVCTGDDMQHKGEFRILGVFSLLEKGGILSYAHFTLNNAKPAAAAAAALC